MKKTVQEFANATISAYQNPYKSVSYIDPEAFNKSCVQLGKQLNPFYFGIKETSILEPMKQAFLEAGFIFHTIDKMSANGRAIDPTLVNPITGGRMTGSSSGTAINVLIGINDIGIGSDGGGSVLAPAMALQLYSMIHPCFPVQMVTKQSTDGLSFSPSSGIITRDFPTLEHTVELFSFKPLRRKLTIAVAKDFPSHLKQQLSQYHTIHQIDFPNVAQKREPLIAWLKTTIKEYDCLLSLEGPIDVESYGDSVIGSFSPISRAQQEKSGKGLLRIVNMLDLVGVSVPYGDLAKGLLIIGEKADTNALLGLAKSIEPQIPELVERYFHKGRC